MKKFLVAAALALPVGAWATCTVTQPNATTAKVVCTTANESAPTLVTEGMNAANCKKGLTLFVCADDTRTLSGTGNVKLYVWNDYAKKWGEVPDLQSGVTVSGTQCMGFGSFVVNVRGPRVQAIPVSVGVSAGGFTSYLSCE